MAKSTKSAAKPAMKALAIEVQMTLERETKGTFVYKADNGGAVTSLYIQREALPDGAPPIIVLKIS